MGPLDGVRVIELPNIGPTQFAGMALADLGAEVLRLDRATSVAAGSGHDAGVAVREPRPQPALASASTSSTRDGAATVLRLCESRRRPASRGSGPAWPSGSASGPTSCCARNPRLVYGRMTGWGQDGPLAHDVGHDINYIALAGVLAHIGTAGGPPVPPINLIGDFGGGGLLLAFGDPRRAARARAIRPRARWSTPRWSTARRC